MYALRKAFLTKYLINDVANIVLEYCQRPNIEKWTRNNHKILMFHFKSVSFNPDAFLNDIRLITRLNDSDSVGMYIDGHIDGMDRVLDEMGAIRPEENDNTFLYHYICLQDWRMRARFRQGLF
jgi:hypothetical protein